ncbi:hypothetical protein Dip510_000246 [Elusimicrobium posterum]|uniref:AsmA-like C-terminal region-containing protein n=1 Tax=Elusimicrobium posterum TaxID=3116653 RepID=UPI003C74BC0B
MKEQEKDKKTKEPEHKDAHHKKDHKEEEKTKKESKENKEVKEKKKPKRSLARRGFHFTKRFIKTLLALTIKTLTFFSLFMVVLAALSWMLFVKYFNAQQITQLISNEVRTVLDRPVIIQSMDLKFFNSIKIDGFKVLDTNDEHGASIIDAQSVILHYNPLPLLQRELVIESVVLKSPRIIITKDKYGNFNVPEIKLNSSAISPAGAATGAAARPFKVTIEDWEIEDGTFIFRDLQNNTNHAIYEVNAKFKNLDFNKSSAFVSNFVLRNASENNIVEVVANVNGKVNFANFNWQKFSLRNTAVKLDFFKKPVTVVFDLDNLKTPFISFKAKFPALQDQDLSLFLKKPLGINFPESEISMSALLKNSYQQLSVSKFQVKASDINASGSGNVSFAKGPVNIDFNVKTDDFNLSDKHKIYSKIQPYAFTGKASLNIKGSYKENKLDLPFIEATLKNAGAKFGTLNGGFNISKVSGIAYLKNNSDIMGTQLTNGTLKLGKQTFTNVEGYCEYSSSKNKLNAFVHKAKINGIPMKISTDITNFRNDRRRQITTKLYIKNFDAMPFYEVIEDFVYAIVKPSKKSSSQKPDTSNLAWLHFFKSHLPSFMPNFKGFIVADTFSSSVLSGKNFTTEFDLKNLLPGMDKLSGKVDARMENGVIYQLEKRAAEEKVLGIAFQPFLVMHRMEKSGSFKVGTILKDVNYKEVAASTDFENGFMIINNFYSDGNTLGVAANGNVNWAAENMNMTLWTIFRNTSRSGALAENLTDESGAPALSFRVHDKMENPKVEMLRPRKSGSEIKKAVNAGLRTDFKDPLNFKLSENDIKKLEAAKE